MSGKTIEIKCHTKDYLPLDALRPFQGNLKNLTEGNYVKLKNNIVKQGFSFPIFVWNSAKDNFILDGHQRVRTLEKMKQDGFDIPQIPIVYVHANTYREAKEKLMSAASQFGEFDDQGLYEFITENEFEPDYIGENYEFAGLDYGSFMTNFYEDNNVPEAGLIGDDEIPEPTETRCKPGDLWILGNHRLLCGDSTDVLQVERLMGGEKADMVFTDPPYGIDYKGGSKKRNEIANDNIPVLQFYSDFLILAKTMSKAGASIYIWHASTETHNCINAAINSGWLYKQYIIWRKNNSTFGRQDYHWQHEPCFYGWGKDGSHAWYGDRKQTTVWDIDRPSKSEEHPTMKPVDLCIKAIINSSQNDHIIYEPFCGSGSTLIACEKTGRKCYGMEIDPHYCSVILARWEKFTGKQALLSQ